MRNGGRRSIRWRGFNYAAPRAYFVTFCVSGRRCLLGQVTNDRVVLSPTGKLVEDHWLKIPATFRHAELDAFVIMPNHVHAILRLGPPDDAAALSERAALSDIVRWWKSQTAIAHGCALWQRNYYERVIRDDDELAHARGYVARNPRTWCQDPENPASVVAP